MLFLFKSIAFIFQDNRFRLPKQALLHRKRACFTNPYKFFRSLIQPPLKPTIYYFVFIAMPSGIFYLLTGILPTLFSCPNLLCIR